MGRPIVYCGICGKSLREDDFTKGRAHLVDNAPYCVTCRLLPEALPGPAPKPSVTPPPLVPRPSGASSKSLPAATPRRHQPSVPDQSSSMGLVIGIAVVVLAIIIVAVILMNSGGPSSAPPAAPTGNGPPNRAPDPPRPPAAPRPSGSEEAETAIRSLEAFASSASDPQAVLDRCEELKAKLRGTPHLSRLEAVEARAIEARNVRNRDRQLAMSLEGVQKLRDLDPRFERRQEIVNMLQAAIAVAGPRKAEVEKVLADYQKAADAFAAKPPDPTPAPKAAPPSGRLGPYDLDDSGAVRHWLVLGPFPNRPDRNALYDGELVKTEAGSVPTAGVDVATRQGTKLTWTPISASGATVLLRTVESLNAFLKPQDPAIVYAACWLNAEKDVDVRFRIVADQGIMVWVDHKMFWSEANAKGLNGNEVVLQMPLATGPHLVLLKVATTGTDFGFRFRVTQESGSRVPGLRVWTQAPGAAKILFAENFNQGRGLFVGGQIVADGVDGTQALAIPKKGAVCELRLHEPAGPTWTVRFKAKPLREMNAIELLIWSSKSRVNYRYHVRGLKKDQWTLIEVKAAQLNTEWYGKGQNFEGELANVITVYYDDAVPDGSLLLDDLEVLE